ncbi:MAG: DNA recombination protein RmuC [Planctomycetota bacterium]
MVDWVDALLGLVLGLLLGGAGTAAFLLARRGRQAAAAADARARYDAARARVDDLEGQLADADTRREDAERRAATLDERVKAFEEAGRMLRESFRATGAEALAANSRQFVDLARRTLETVLTEARGDVEKRQQAIDAVVKPIRELLERHGAAVTDIEKKREVAYRGLEEQIRQIATAHEKLHAETGRLVTALRRPEQRGRWGEMQLRNAVELAGMTAHCDFHEQPATDDPETRDRPDMTVRLPGGGVIVVDAKVALDAYLAALEADADRAAEMKRHAAQVAEHVRRLSTKRYWSQFERAPKLVVMFMPLESALTAALETRPGLHAEAMEQHVLVATPTLLVALLRAVAFGWQQEDVAANAREIARVGAELYKRLATFAQHLEKVGKGLEGARKAYNASIGSLETRVLVSARELKRLHVTTEPSVERPDPLATEARAITATELKDVPPVDAPALPAE